MTEECRYVENEGKKYFRLGGMLIEYNARVSIIMRGRVEAIVTGRIVCYQPQYGTITVIDDDGVLHVIRLKDIKHMSVGSKHYKPTHQ